jgi:hypothetical protein
MKFSFHRQPSGLRSGGVSLLAFALAMTGLFGMNAVVAREAQGVHRFAGAVPRRAPFAAAKQAERAQQQQQRALQRQAQQQAAQRPAEAQAAPVHNDAPADAPQERGKPGRLTPDERRALRQQINDAGREIYRPARP